MKKTMMTALLFCAWAVGIHAQSTTIDLADAVATSGSISVDESCISNTKNGAYAIYEVSVGETALYDISVFFGTKKDGSSISIDMDTDLDALKARPQEPFLTRATSNPNDWNARYEYGFGPFKLAQGKIYYLRITFTTTSGSWVGNVHEICLEKSVNQEATDFVEAGASTNDGYALYSQNFDGKSTIYPFYRGWAWEPNYIEKKEDSYLEFYYNAQALADDDRRQRRGAEITCGYNTTTSGWYGFRFYLPEGKFPMDEGGIIIAQMFNQGCRNSWAGHLSIDNGVLKLSRRHALVDPVVASLGKLETNKWYSVVVYFKVGINNKGRVKVWLGDNMTEASPVYDSGACNFGFGHWLDDETLDDTGTNEECINHSSYGGKDRIGCKFGLYVSNSVDITIRMDDIKALQGNPTGAFGIVNPSKGSAAGINLINDIPEGSEDAYTPSGMKLKDASQYNGLYIKNGKVRLSFSGRN
ncbi:MAG: heparin lyase I family protein [Prevotella sp.]